MEKYDELVRSHPFWRKLDPRHLGVLKECVTMVRFGLGQPIFQAGSNAEQFYLIHTGRVGLEMFVRGKGIVTIQTVDAGEAFGWSWLFPPYRWYFDARAHQVTDALVFPAQTLRVLTQDCSRLLRCKCHGFLLRHFRPLLQRC